MKGLDDDIKIIEDWPLKDVVFVEDQKSLPIGIDFYLENNFLTFFLTMYYVFRTCCSCGWFLCRS